MNVKVDENNRGVKVIFFLIAFTTAVVIVSHTIGRELLDGRTQSLESFALIHFSGYLFFLIMPVEMAFVYYLPHFQISELVIVAMLTAVMAQIIDYVIGYAFRTKLISYLVGKQRILKSEKYIRRYGNLTIFVFNLLPLSSPIIALVAGMIRIRFLNLMIYSVSGLFLKYLILLWIF